MAGCIEEAVDGLPDWTRFKSNLNEQIDEIEALKSYYENTDYLEIFEEASQSENKKFSLQLKIPIETSSKPIKVEIWLPLDQLKKESSSESNRDPNKPSLERTISGKRAHATIECNYLSPIQVDISLPDSYPSENKPVFTITCDWLSRSQITDLSLKLNQIWEENQSMPILFTWFEWVKSNLVEYLNLFDPPNTINLTPMSEDDDTAHNDLRSAEEIIVDLMRHNFIEEIKEYRNTPQNCMICFDEKMGAEFIRLNGCKHHFCLVCMSDMCRMHVKEGTIQLLKCPNTECKEFVPIDVMSQVLTDEEFDRWERLLFQRTLDTMEDVIYCPKCTNPIIVDQSDSHAYCMICNLDYCKLCKDMWHSGKCSSNEEKIQERVERLQITAKGLMNMTEQEIRLKFKNSAYVLELKKKSAENENDETVTKFLAKCIRCPKCDIPIEKLEGCNKIICRCGCIICYVCGKQIQGYGHFENNEKCLLWTPTSKPALRRVVQVRHEGEVRMERVLNLMPEQKRNVINCITCGQPNLKMDKNNHIKCWLCKTNFCYECHKKIFGNISAHFMGSGDKCKQHSK